MTLRSLSLAGAFVLAATLVAHAADISGKWTAQVTFAEPGDYVLRAVASDGSIFTYDNVTVSVTR